MEKHKKIENEMRLCSTIIALFLSIGMICAQETENNDIIIENDSLMLPMMNSTGYSAEDYRVVNPQILPMSPNAASFAIFADYPVSHYTGVPDITIPIYEIKIDDISIPITLKYHASGIRASQEASWVGLGWTLDAGGVITRTVKCFDDFKEYEYPPSSIKKGYYEGPEVDNPLSEELYVYNIDAVPGAVKIEKKLGVDSEPDIFCFSLPGASGKFLLDKSRGAVLFDKSNNVKIAVTQNTAGKKSFIITTPNGIKYHYDKRETTYQYSKKSSLNENSPNATVFDETELLYDFPVRYTSSWCLSKIVTTNNREILFHYVEESYKAPVQESCIKYNLDYVTHPSCGPLPAHPYYSKSKVVLESWRLSKIVWDNGYAIFSATPREDQIGENTTNLAPKKLDNIMVYSSDGSLINHTVFNYSYFNNNNNTQYKHVFKRLKLDEMVDGLDPNKKYSFTYHNGTMPAKNSKNVDYWGYYNGKNYGNKYYCAIFDGRTMYDGVIKFGDFEYMKLGTLWKIKHPTGGSTVFTYESNKFLGSEIDRIVPKKMKTKYVNVFTGYHEEYPGLPPSQTDTFTISRIGKMRISGNLENYSNLKDPTYNYNGAEIARLRRISPTRATLALYETPELYDSNLEHVFSSKIYNLTPGTYVFEALTPPRDVVSSWVIDMDYVEARPADTPSSGGGLRIAQIESDGIVKKFEYSPGVLLIEPILHYLRQFYCTTPELHGSARYLAQASESAIPLTTFCRGNSVGYDYVKEYQTNGAATKYHFYNEPEESLSEEDYILPTAINYMNGLPQSITHYAGTQVVSNKTYTYDHHYSPVVYGFVHDEVHNTASPYNYRVQYFFIKSEETNTFDMKNKNNYVDEVKTFSYNDYFQPLKNGLMVSGESHEQKIFYPTDFSDNISAGMTDRHMINVPVEIIALKNNKVIHGKKTEYMDTLNMYLPKTIYTLNPTTPLSESAYRNQFTAELFFEKYNTFGKPVQIRDLSGESIVYLWSYKGEYPIAEIRNADYNAVKRVLTETFINGVLKKGSPSAADMTSINALRSALPDAFITTLVYKPLVGVVSITDPRGITNYYDYDSQGRLKEVYYYATNSGEKRIIESYDYHYKTP